MIITNQEIYRLLSQVCDLMNKNNIDYLVYGSAAFNLYTHDNSEMNDLDLIVKESDFEKISQLLKDLNLNPIKTPYSIHANSTVFEGNDGKQFDVSLDSYEHYFSKLGIDLNNYHVLDLEGIQLKVMFPDDLIKIYTVGLQGNNEDKIEKYQYKIDKLKQLKMEGE